MASIYDQSVTKRDGSELSLSEFKGKAILVVNTATGCGFTPQYKQLEELYEKYHDQGFEIIDVPCNQFAGQAPQDDEGIHQFCTLKYDTKFDQMKKSDVNGEHQIPLFAFCKSVGKFHGLGKGFKAKLVMKAYNSKGKVTDDPDDIHWNFTKFLFDKEGNFVGRYEPTEGMKVVEEAIAKVMA